MFSQMRLRFWFAGILVIAAFAMLMIWRPWESGEPAITAQDAEQTVLDQYPGKIEQSVSEDGQYKLRLRSESGLYQVDVDADSGKVISITQVENKGDTEPKSLLSREQVKAGLQSSTKGGEIVKLELIDQAGKQVYHAVVRQQNDGPLEMTLDPYTAEILSSRIVSSSQQGKGPQDKLLTESEASKLALAEIPGEVDDVELRGVDSGTPYYLVEIDLVDGREATVEINAISGVIRTVTWDEDEPDKD
ncbi:peptidase YpeB-like protein [Fontibacillus phaseoli]|uniref:Peptidase YpeB-like protein n=2 Tax=Fontibacillus phaseoli TaxID=1416533 RepID=A0A369BQD7_9BACL|nr:peptidase YpeB-like protein [Fontibacillus phaseoli]